MSGATEQQPTAGSQRTTRTLSDYARERSTLLDRIVQLLEADHRVAAAWLSGSFGRGEADDWSDLDLHVAIKEEHFTAFLTVCPS